MFTSRINASKKLVNIKYSNFANIEVPILEPTDPVWGNLIDVRNEGGSWHHYCTKMHEKIGPVFYLWVKNQKAISIGHPKYWNPLSHLNERPDSLRGFMKELTGKKAINFANGDVRVRYQQYINSTFSKEAIAEKQYKIIDRQFAKHFPNWIKYAETGEKFPMLNRFDYCTISMMVEVIFGVEDYSEHKLIQLNQYLKDTFAELEIKSFLDEFDPARQKIMVEKITIIKETIRDLISTWEKKPKTGEKNCFLDYIELEGDPEAMFSNSMNFVTAAPTIAKTQAYIVYALAKHPEIQRKVQKEIDNHITTDEIVQTKNLKGLRYMRACINEALRLYSPSANFARIDSHNDNDIGDGIIIPKNTPIIMPFLYVLLSDKFWKEPQKFHPERFKEDGLKFSLQYQPFGFAGGRVCTGKVISDNMLQVITAGIFKNFNVTIPNNQELKLQVLSAVTPLEEIYASFKFRKH